MPLGQFLFEYLYRRGVRHSFGIPGDFALPTFTWLEKSKIQNTTMTHEPAAGFAADAYSRINGIGLVCVTYCVGGLNVLNAIAGASSDLVLMLGSVQKSVAANCKGRKGSKRGHRLGPCSHLRLGRPGDVSHYDAAVEDGLLE